MDGTKRARSTSLAAAVAAAVVLGATASSALAAFPGQAGRIAFSVNVPGPDIATVNPDGSALQLLTHNAPGMCPCDLDPTWSPDGGQVAFARLEKNGGPFRIWVINADGTNAHPVSPGPSDQGPAWSPGGGQLVYTSKAGTGNNQLAVINVDGSGFHLIGPAGIGTGSPSWSPDNASIAFNHSGPRGSTDLFAIRPDGSGLRDLTNNPGPSGCGGPESIDPDWSPDARRLAYSGDETVCGNPVVMTIGADGSGRTQLGQEDPPGPEHQGQLGPVWSPDGTHIAYAQPPPASLDFQIYVMDADGGNPHAITSGAFAHRDPSWQPRPTTHATSTDVRCVPNPVEAGRPTTCTATVSDVDGGTKSTPGGTVGFTSGGPGSFSAATCALAPSSPGRAQCSVRYTPAASPRTPVRSDRITAVYRGDVAHSASRGSTTVNVLSIGRLTRGSFVIGDRSSALGARVTFWGAQWAKQNALSGGIAPSSFKGFASHSQGELPQCGQGWTSETGDGSGPPASVPEYMAVIASSRVSQRGRTISGDSRAVVVVKADRGYGQGAGHPGTGTVVGQICP